ncbi:DUF2614 family zinc ribbon-containing protein, partial [Bacillus pumilus]|uniref:DUF2614 family zinc ribbon-containing protein n=1 Tax=Bacillus pumilus TaxID=1408 RepID=UPI0028CB6017
MPKYSTKINKITTFALSFLFLPFLIIYIRLFFKQSICLSTFFILLPLLSIGFSTLLYFSIAILSTNALRLVCP